MLLHCVVDAIFGALGLPDIGQIFPDSDPKWKGAPSSISFLVLVLLFDGLEFDLTILKFGGFLFIEWNLNLGLFSGDF